MTSFKNTTPSQSGNGKKWVFQDHHTLLKYQLLKISSFKTSTPSQSIKLLKFSSLKNYYTPSKVETVKIDFFQDHHILPK